ncbi:MAG: ABC transporter substrate-binding protein [Thermodesulfobacteriota bacterium]
MRIVKEVLILVYIFVLYSCSNSPDDSIQEKICPVKIASLSLASDEILLDIIDDSRIIGVTYLAGNKNLSNVYLKSGSVPNKLRPNLEQLIEVRPDLVIVADYIDFGFLNQIKKSGIKTLYLKDINSVENINKNILLIGDVVCEKEKAQKIVSDMVSRIEDIKKRELISRPEILYLFPSLFTSGANSTIGEIIEIAGGINIGKVAGIDGNKKISREYILDTDPDIIIVGSYSIDNKNFIENLKSDKVLKNLTAIKKNHVYQIETKHLTTVSHHIVKGIEDVSDIIDGYNLHLNADKKKTTD